MAVSPFPSAKTCFFRECLTFSILALSVEWSRDCAALKMDIVLRIMRFEHYAQNNMLKGERRRREQARVSKIRPSLNKKDFHKSAARYYRQY